MEFEVVLEHAQQVFFQTHHQRMNPGIEEHVGAFETHLRGIAGREILHMHRRRNHGARQAKSLGDMAFHLRAQHQLGREFRHARFNFEVVVGDQWLDAVFFGGFANLARKFPAVGAKTNHFKAQLFRGHTGRCDGVRCVTKHEHTLASR